MAGEEADAVQWVHWQSGTARLLPPDRRPHPRTAVPSRPAPAPARTLAAADLCPRTGRGRLSYGRAEYLFKQATKKLDPGKRGYTLHQLRHPHLGEDGWSAPMLMALSGHENIRSLAMYVNISAEAVAATVAEHHPARRHR